jgi:hypothetical protein
VSREGRPERLAGKTASSRSKERGKKGGEREGGGRRGIPWQVIKKSANVAGKIHRWV